MQNILIIEDNDDTYLLLSRLLEKNGYHSDCILRYSTIAEVAKSEITVDIVLTDLGLSDSDSLETFERVYDKFPYAPILVLTGHQDVEIANRTIKQGAQDYLIKGEFDEKVLAKAIQYAIERKRIVNGYRRIFQENPAPMYIFQNDNHRFLDVNDAALHQYGYSREEFMQLSAVDIRPPEAIAAFVNASRNVPDDYTDFGRWQHIRKTGQIFFVHVYAHNTDFEGKSARIVLALDIDNKVRTEKALNEKVAEVENILESIADGFFAINNNWEFTYVNHVFEKKLQSTREELLGKSLWDQFPAAKEMLFYTEYHNAMKNRVNVQFEEYYSPMQMWVSVNAYPTNNGLAVYFTDITEQKSIQDKIFINEQNLRAIVNNTKDIIWSIDRQYNIITSNDVFWERIEDITGKKQKDLTNLDFADKRITKWNNYFKRSLEGETFKVIEYDTYKGGEIYEEISFNPIRNKANEIIGVSCFSRDITKELLHLKMIEKQNEQLREIAWIQSHEVRSPVASILGLTELFNKTDPTDPINGEIIDKLKIASDKLDEIIRKITSNTIISS